MSSPKIILIYISNISANFKRRHSLIQFLSHYFPPSKAERGQEQLTLKAISSSCKYVISLILLKRKQRIKQQEKQDNELSTEDY